jgi:8-oxo-dGTP pyrophosphatase MutT (NUDIX family)
MYIAAECRRKTNEVVIGRPDMAAVVLYRPGRGLADTEVVLVQEYRTPATTADGYIWEIPSGSSLSPGRRPLDIGLSEVMEETGLVLPAEAVRFHAARQAAGTLSVHKVHLFSAELTDEQVAQLRAEETRGEPHGDATESERTFVRVRTVSDILADGRVDWSNLGMILAVLRDRLGDP